MSATGWIQLLVFIALLLVITKPMGLYLVRMLDPAGKTFLDFLLKPVERLLYCLFGVNPMREQSWKQYTIAVLVFSLVTGLFTYGVLRLQGHLPWHHYLDAASSRTALTPDLAFNTAMSFTTNTNWQSYAGENTMSYFSQMVALTSHNFWSAAVGIAIAAALVRGLARDKVKTIGNFWADIVRVTLYLLLPICIVYALFLVSQGMIENFKPYTTVTAIDQSGASPGMTLTQTIAQGPVASQVAIKMLGTNGGGFMNANAAHPYENPTPLWNFIQLLSIFAIPTGLIYYLGRMVKNQWHGWAVWSAMFALFLVGVLLSAIGIAGIDRMVQHNVLAMSGRAVEAAGDVDVLLLDKTGTITLGNREATEFVPAPGITREELADAAQLSSLADETPEGRSVVVLAKKYGIRGREIHELPHAEFVPFTAQTRMSGVNMDGQQIRKGAADAVRQFVGGSLPREVEQTVERISKAGGTPLVVASSNQPLGVIHLKDIVKGGLPDRFQRFRAMGIKTVMITGDNPLTAAAIAAEAGVDDFLAQAKPEDKLRLLRDEQAAGHLVAMTGDGTNDAPALAQADVGVAMNTGTQAAKEAGNMVDLDSNPTKLIEVVEIGKQMLMTRGALTTFSIANDVAKYFAIIPAILVGAFAAIEPLNIMRLRSPYSAILSAVIFNALIIIVLVPLALRGVKFRPLPAAVILRRNLLIYGLGGLIVPFIGIKLIDLLINAFHLV